MTIPETIIARTQPGPTRDALLAEAAQSGNELQAAYQTIIRYEDDGVGYCIFTGNAVEW
jgi:hypothetical protein